MKRLFTKLSSLGLFVSSVITVQAQTSVNYEQRVAHYDAAAVFSSGAGGIFNNSTNEVGMYANASGSKQAVAWRRFKTNGDNTGADTELGIGTEFKITVAAKRAYGRIGVALLSSPTAFGSWANREENAAVSVNLDGPAYTGSSYGLWYVKTGTTQAATFGGEQDVYRDYTIIFFKTAADKMNVTITNNNGATSIFTDVTLSNTDAITHYAIYMQDDWSGNAQSNIFWKPTTVLPVSLVSFNAKLKNQATALTWATATEINTTHFEVERSTNNRSWETIGTVKAAGKAADYNFTDYATASGINFYRLKMVDNDSKTTYSRIISVENALNTLTVYPNPAKSVLTIETDADTEGGAFEVVDMLGRVVLRSNKTNTLDISPLNTGVYNLHLVNKTGQIQKQVRFVKE